jgi:hypothetical protein
MPLTDGVIGIALDVHQLAVYRRHDLAASYPTVRADGGRLADPLVQRESRYLRDHTLLAGEQQASCHHTGQLEEIPPRHFSHLTISLVPTRFGGIHVRIQTTTKKAKPDPRQGPFGLYWRAVADID